MRELVSRPHAGNLVRWAEHRPHVLVLSADLSASCEVDDFQRAYPDRFFSMGMAEQNMMGFAAGLAREGFSPYIHTFAVFIYRRPYDQVALSIAYPNLPVRLLGFLPGIISPGGSTHQAIEDVAVLRALPNMTILECGDATEVESVLDVAEGSKGPVYVRMLRGEVPRLFDRAEPMRLNTARPLSAGTAVAEALADAGIGRKLVRLGLQDTFAHGASRPYLMKRYGLDALALVNAAEKLLGASFDLTDADLEAARPETVRSSRAEAL